MTQPNPAQVPPFDGSSGNVISRAEPKVRAASLTALLSPIALYYLYRYVPGVSHLPHELDAVAGALIVGVLTFLAGFAAKAVDRVDLFARHEAAKVDTLVEPVVVKTIGQRATDELKHVAHELYADVVPPVESAVKTAVSAVETAVGAGANPVSAVEAAVKPVEDAAVAALDVAVADGRAEAPAVVTDVVTGAAASVSNADLADLLRTMLAKLGDPSATPIADAAATATGTSGTGTVITNLPPVPVTTTAPATIEMPAVAPAPEVPPTA